LPKAEEEQKCPLESEPGDSRGDEGSEQSAEGQQCQEKTDAGFVELQLAEEEHEDRSEKAKDAKNGIKGIPGDLPG
jgi:hypothetical protein